METTPKKKVLYLITKSNWGGAQRYVYDLASSLDGHCLEPVVALGGEGMLVDMLDHAHIRTISITSLQRDVSLKKEIAFAKELWSILRTEKPDVLHVNSSKAAAIGSCIGRLAGIKTIVFTAHGWSFNESRPWWQRILLKAIHWFTVLCSHKTIAVSHAIVSQLQWLGIRNKFTVIHPGRTIGAMYSKEDGRTKICERRPLLSEYKNNTWIMSVAELHPIKRHDMQISAMKELHKKFPDTKLLIAGDGEMKLSLEKQIAAHHLEDVCFLIGALPEAARFLRAADIFIHTSDSEAYGYVIHEAGLAEVPVIATDVGGVSDIITNGSDGTLIPKGDTSTLIQALEHTLENPTDATEQVATLKEKMTDRSKEKMATATTAVYNLALK